MNDRSTDESRKIIEEVSSKARTTSVSIINMSYFHGLELAMNAGLDLSIGDFVFEFDNTTLDFETETVMNVYKKSLEGFDIVSATPDKKERFSSRLFYRVFDRFSHISYKMTTESFRILSRRVINRLSSMNNIIPYRKALYANCGLKTANIKYKTLDKVKNDMDKEEKHYRLRLAEDALILFTELGYRFSIGMTILMMLLSLFMVIYSVVIYAAGHPVAGWTTTILFLSVAFLGLFGILTFVVKYLQLLIDMSVKRKHYSFESIEKFTK